MILFEIDGGNPQEHRSVLALYSPSVRSGPCTQERCVEQHPVGPTQPSSLSKTHLFLDFGSMEPLTGTGWTTQPSNAQ